MTERLVTTIAAAGAALAVLAPTANAAVNFDAPLSFAANSPSSIAVGDFNGDGNQDVAAATTSPPAVKVLLGTGSGNFTDGPAVTVTGPDPLTAIAAGPVSNDGRDDLVLLRDAAGAGRIEPFLWNGNGFDPGTATPVLDDPRDVVLGRFDPDANLDAAVATGSSRKVSIRLGNGSGFLAPGTDVSTAGPTPAVARSVAARDFTGDGVIDLAIATPAGAQVARGDGPGTFQQPTGSVVASDVNVVAPVDLNHDGLADIAAGTGTGISVARSTGGGAFTNPQAIPGSTGNVSALAAADLDGDTIDDLLATYTSGDNAGDALAFFGRGDETFGDSRAVDLGSSAPSDLGIADFNRDGNLDFVASNSGGVARLQAIPPSATVASPDSFGNQAPNTESTARAVTVRNNGAPRLRPGAVTLGGANPDQFRIVTNTCTGANLAIGQECAVAVTFRPNNLGTRSATVSIASNAAGSPASVQLTGTGANPTTGPTAGTCVNTQNGSAAAETITGTAEGDNLFGFGGNDVLNGFDGNDCLTGGEGNDRLNGGNGRDTLEGNNGNDVEIAGSGNDKLSGGAGRDTLSAGTGNDSVNGGSGNDSLSGSSGNDTLNGSTGNDKISGGSGKNRYNGGPGNDAINAANGRIETVDCSSGRDSVVADPRDRVKRCEKIRRKRG